MALNQNLSGNNNNNHIRQPSECTYIFTHQLPYGVRRSIYNLLDADQSWRTLAGQFIGFNVTELTLLGQAYMRCCSPTEELMLKLDSRNMRISELCYFLEQMNHYRALDVLKPYLEQRTSGGSGAAVGYLTTIASSNESGVRISQTGQTLATPTPSFSEQAPALMDCSGMDLFRLANEQNGNQDWLLPQLDQDRLAFQANDQPVQQQQLAPGQGRQSQEPRKCHREHLALSTEEVSTQPIERRLQQREAVAPKQRAPDPGEEIVRLACATNRKRTSISNQEVVNQLRLIMQISYKELKMASNDFSDSNILGNGGFASVYRGNWKGTDVAVKRLKCNLMDQALNELTILNSYRIDNILPIYGISLDGPEACLVYQFMANGSLEDRLACKKGSPPLTWTQRALIGEGVAKGLYYLHTLRDKPLVHGDVKSANVLLDSQLVPKLGDFGLARQVFRGKNPQTELCTHCTVSSIHGTSVYLPPEYLRHKVLSSAVDVYSYGIVLLEMATGKRAYDGKRLLIDLVQDESQSIGKGEISYSLKDPKLADDTQSDLKIWFELLIKLGLVCADKSKQKRPDMGRVLNRFFEFRASAAESSALDQTLSHAQQSTFTLGSLRAPSTSAAANKPSQVDESSPAKHNHPQQQKHAMNNIGQLNSNLMSVEEEEVGDRQPATNNHQEVDAMIPLLTEFGVTTSP